MKTTLWTTLKIPTHKKTWEQVYQIYPQISITIILITVLGQLLQVKCLKYNLNKNLPAALILSTF